MQHGDANWDDVGEGVPFLMNSDSDGRRTVASACSHGIRQSRALSSSSFTGSRLLPRCYQSSPNHPVQPPSLSVRFVEKTIG